MNAGGVTQLKINTAFLFARMATRHLEEDGQLVILLPTTYATASSLTSLRREMAEKLSVRRIHLFIANQKNVARSVPLKKNFIIAYRNGEKPTNITVTTSKDSGKLITELPPLAYDFVVDKDSGMLTLPKSTEDTNIVRYISDFPETLASLGLKMSTGLVIESKCKNMLFNNPIDETIPVLRAASMKGGLVEFPRPIPNQYLAPTSPSLMQKNKNLIIIKRIPAKSDERFVNSAIYLSSWLPAYKYAHTIRLTLSIPRIKTTKCPRALLSDCLHFSTPRYTTDISLSCRNRSRLTQRR